MCTVSPRMKALGAECLGMTGFVSFAIWGHCVMRSMWYLNAQLCKVYAMNMLLCFLDVCTMQQFLWQDDLVSVAKFIHACLDKMFSCATGLSNDSQASDQPDVAGRDVI